MANRRHGKKAPKKPAKKALFKKIKNAVKKVGRKLVRKKASPAKTGKRRAFALATLSPTEREVRLRIISSAGGLGATKPEDLTDDMRLKENLNYTATDFNVLQGSLDEFVKSKDPAAKVLSSDISNNKSVGKITAMVKLKIHEA
jgi:hypothetical protein